MSIPYHGMKAIHGTMNNQLPGRGKDFMMCLKIAGAGARKRGRRGFVPSFEGDQ